MQAHILVVEDEEKLARFVELELEHEGYKVSKAFDGRTALEMAGREEYDLILLDIMLPELNGLEVLRRLKQDGRDIAPVILVTARDAVMDKVSGLDAGAVDYITKPFAIEELLARIRAALRKPRARQNQPAEPESSVLRAGQLVLDPERYSVAFDGEPVALTKKEFDLLHYLMERKGKAATRDAILNDVWGYDYTGDTNVVDVYVRYLRHKIDDRFGIRTIQTIRSVGYVFNYE